MIQGLTEIEKRTLMEYSQGLTYKQIGIVIHRNHETVKSILRKINYKLDVSNNRLALSKAIVMNIIEPKF